MAAAQTITAVDDRLQSLTAMTSCPAVGGIMGYMKKGSQKSVIAGVTTGAILLAAAHLMGTAASFKVGIRLAFGARPCLNAALRLLVCTATW